MSNVTRVAGFRTADLSSRWKFALFGFPLLTVVTTLLIAVTLWVRLDDVVLWSDSPKSGPVLTGAVILGDVEGFEVDTFHYPRPTAYVLLATAPFRDFPRVTDDDVMERGGCTKRQHEWLARNARPATDSQSRITLINSRTTGEAITVKNIRAVGASARPVAPTVRVTCSPPPPGPQPLQPGFLTVDKEAIAVFSQVNEEWTPGLWLESGVAEQPAAPLVYRLEPGEDAHLVLEYETPVNFTGQLIATVVADGRETNVNLSSERVFIASRISEDDLWFNVQRGRIHCNDLRAQVPVNAVCTAEHADELLIDYRQDQAIMRPR